MATTRSTFGGNLFLPGALRKVFFLAYKEQPTIYDQIYDVVSSKRKAETDHTVAGLGKFDAKTEGVPLTYEDFVDGYEREYSHTAYAKGIRITRELLDDEQYGVMAKRAQALGRAARYRKEYDHALIFNNATSTTYAGADALALLSNSHTLAAVPGTTVDNLDSNTSLSVAAIESACLFFRKLVDDQNLLIDMQPATLLVPPDLEREAHEILDSDRVPYKADNEVNVFKGRLNIIVWPHITHTDHWFVLCNKAQMAPVSFDRVPLEFERDGDFDTKDLKMSGYMRYSFGFTDWRFCTGYSS